MPDHAVSDMRRARILRAAFQHIFLPYDRGCTYLTSQLIFQHKNHQIIMRPNNSKTNGRPEGGARGHFPSRDLENILLNVFVILVFNNKRL